MKLRDFSKRIQSEDQPDFAHILQGRLELVELCAEELEDFPKTIYIANSQSAVYGKISKETLLYLLDRQNKFHFQQILDAMNDGVIAIDQSGRIFYANPAYVSILEVPLRRILGRKIQEVEPGSLLYETLIKGEPLSSEKQLIPSLQKYVSLRTFPLRDGENILGAVSIFQDVTRLHHLNQEVKQMSGIVDEYTQRIRGQETAEKLGLQSYDRTFQTIIQKAATVALTDVPLLIYGETGTGKNTVAHYLHQCSRRRDRPLVVINCAAVPANMIESVLFGDKEQPGKLAIAEGGTLFLDEIEELPLSAQSRLLYFLQQDPILPNQESKDAFPNVRLIAAANQPLEPMVQAKQFRKELFFKLNTITITLPPLRDRPDDILPLANQFLSQYNKKYHRDVVFSPQTYQELRQHNWPGNLRELKSYVERAVILADSTCSILKRTEETCNTAPSGDPHSLHSQEPLAVQVQAFEKQVIQEALDDCHGCRTAAMKRLGLSRRTFYRKCAEYHLLNQ